MSDLPAASYSQPSSATAPPTARRKFPVGAIVFVVLVVLVLGVLGAYRLWILGQQNMADTFAQAEKARYVVEAFMRNMRDRQVDYAYDLFSTRAREQLLREKLEEMLSDPDYVLFDRFTGIEVQNFWVGVVVLTPAAPGDHVVQLSGCVVYQGAQTGTFEAALELENDRWKLYNINVTVSPAKMQEYLTRPTQP